MMYAEYEKAALTGSIRSFGTTDLVKRLGIISPNHVHITGYSMEHPLAIFNASAILQRDRVIIYARIIAGYYMYISAIVRIDVPLEDILSGAVSYTHYPARLAIKPGVRQDIWGCEDPRASSIDETTYIVYVGRTVWYFNREKKGERTLPVIAFNGGEGVVKKACAVVHPPTLRSRIISDKDSALMRVGDGSFYILHRPHVMMDEGSETYAVVSRLDHKLERCLRGGVRNYELPLISINNTRILLRRAPFESKIGWGTPPIEVGRDKYLALVHGVDNFIEAYRAYAVLLEYRKDEGLIPVAVSRKYVMEPKEGYEVYGDRPYVVFPCGLFRVSNDEAVVVYGAADQVVGFGLMNVSETLSELDKGLIE